MRSLSSSIRTTLLGLAVLTAVGCGGAKQEDIPIKVNDPMVQVKSTLERYAKGSPLGSEVTSFEFMINEVRKVDAAKADTLKAGLDEIQKVKGSPAAKAKELMKKLGIE